jgi:glycosyltransferase involved in cell wall biosynthesis
LRDTFAPKSAALAAKTRVVSNGVDPQVFYPREGMRESKTIFFVGRFDREKGLLELVRAFARVLEDHANARLVIGGTTGFGTHDETPYVHEVRSEALRLESVHPGCVQFPGYIHHDKELPGYFQRATIFTSPSLFQEPFGLVNAEAMACGTAVVGSNRGGIPEVLGDAGVLINPENSDEYAATLINVLAHPERRAEMGRVGIRRAQETFDWKIIAERWMATLDDVSASRSAEITSAGRAGVVC